MGTWTRRIGMVLTVVGLATFLPATAAMVRTGVPMLKEKGCQMAARKAASEIGEAPDPDNGPAQAAPVASLDRSATSKPVEPAPTAPPNRRSFVGAFAGLATALTAAAVGHHLDQTTPTDDTNGSAAVVGHVAPTGHTTTVNITAKGMSCLLYTSPSPRDGLLSRMPSSA